MAKLDKIIIPVINFDDTSLEEAVDFLRLRSFELDPDEDPRMRGISFIVQGAEPVEEGKDPQPVIRAEGIPRIDYRAEKVPLLKALAEICRKFRQDAYLTSMGIVIAPVGTPPFPNAKAEEGEIWRNLTEPEKPAKK